MTFELFRLLLDYVQNLEGLRRDIRGNAQGYSAALTAGTPRLTVLAVIQQDLDEYQNRRIAVYSDRILNDPALLAKLTEAFEPLGLDVNEAVSTTASIKQALTDFAAAPHANNAQVQAAIATLLAAVPAHDSIW